jgi:hypothetical protein
MRAPMLALIGIAVASSGLAGQSTDRHWSEAPPLFPIGAQIAVISGDPGAPGMFTAELKIPDGYRWPPHFHFADERIAVRQGSLLVGMGDKLDVATTKPMVVGDSATTVARMHHYAVAKGETIVAITMNGPYTIRYVNWDEDPQKKATFPF